MVIADEGTREELLLPGEAERVRSGASQRTFSVLGGNHSTIALQRLHQEFPEEEAFKTRRCMVFDNGIHPDLAIRFGQLHNEYYDRKMRPDEFFNLAFEVVKVCRPFFDFGNFSFGRFVDVLRRTWGGRRQQSRGKMASG